VSQPTVFRRLLPHVAVLSGAVSVVLALAAPASAHTAAPASAHTAASGGTWQPAQEVAGNLNVGGSAQVNDLSCGSSGNCAAGGYYSLKSFHLQAFVVSEVNGAWQPAQQIPGLGTQGAGIEAVSCAPKGNCSAGGYYFGPSGSTKSQQAFLVSEVNGTWGKPEEVPGLAKIDSGGAIVQAMACASAGNCSASGFYIAKSGGTQAFVVDEVNGTWRTAEEIPGLGALVGTGTAEPQSVSCASAGNCAVAGLYFEKAVPGQGFVADEVNGTWRTAQEITGPGTLGAGLESVSCPSAGNCGAGGTYNFKNGNQQPFVVNEVNGTWGKAEAVPGAGVPQTGGGSVTSVSCSSAGNCSASGSVSSGSSGPAGFVVDEVNGTWQTLQKVSGVFSLGTVSCGSAGNCSAGGFSPGDNSHAVFVNEVNGTWGKAQPVSGLTMPDGASIYIVSCAAAGRCSAGGVTPAKGSDLEAIVANET
jgi:hypothetical protein